MAQRSDRAADYNAIVAALSDARCGLTIDELAAIIYNDGERFRNARARARQIIDRLSTISGLAIYGDGDRFRLLARAE